ncbi:PP2C family protein-serine/threonine phosphatase [Pseudonocardia nantongensis]|uniref:PP2C family protein-serine/threonine phosphatase n=1 Tax=Pseudonocardia nantongensis TaxID=1181885 RepID=UPI00397A4B96
MTDDPRAAARFGALLERVEEAPPVEAVAVLAAELARMGDAREVSFLITDYSGDSIVRLIHQGPGDRERGPEYAETVPLPGSVYEQVLRTQRPDIAPHEPSGATVVVPVTSRGEAIGALDLVLPNYPDERLIADIAAAAHALAHVIIANRRHTDLFAWGQRTTPPTLAAEVQRRLLPDSFSCEAGQLTVAGWLEPSASIAGDTFDYALDRDTLHISITDAVGHSLDSSLLATVLVSSLRNSRRRGAGLAEQARTANEALVEHTTDSRFVTGQLARINLDEGTATIVNAGHPLPFRLRNGAVERVHLAVDYPFGIQARHEFGAQKLALEPGDRLILLTDGMLERQPAHFDLARELTRTADLHPREATRALSRAASQASGGTLRDDAAVLCIDWYGGPPRPRSSTAGASEQLASH